MRKTKRAHIVALLIALLMAIGGISLGVSAMDEYSEGYFKFIIEGGQVTITEYFGDEREVEIYDYIAAMPVTRIKGRIFKNNPALTKVTIPDTVTQIDSDLFDGLTQLKTVILQSRSITVRVPEGCTVIEDYPIYVDPGTFETITGTASTTTAPTPADTTTVKPSDTTTAKPSDTTVKPADTTTSGVGFEEVTDREDDTSAQESVPPTPGTTTAPQGSGETTAPTTTTPGSTTPSDTTPDSTTPGDTTPDTTIPGGTTAQGTDPAIATSDVTPPESTPDSTTSEKQTDPVHIDDGASGGPNVVVMVLLICVGVAAVIGVGIAINRAKLK